MEPSTAPTVRARPLAGAGLDTSAGSTFVQQRLRLMAKVVFLLSFGFYVVINGIFIASGTDPVELFGHHHNIWHLTASSVMAVIWVLAGLRPWSYRALGLLDVAGAILAGTTLSIMAAGQTRDTLWNTLLAVTVTLMARAVLVPSTATRTCVLSIAAALPVIVVASVYSRCRCRAGSRRSSSSWRR